MMPDVQWLWEFAEKLKEHTELASLRARNALKAEVLERADSLGRIALDKSPEWGEGFREGVAALRRAVEALK